MGWEEFASNHPFLFSITIATVAIVIGVTICGLAKILDKEAIKSILSDLVFLWLLVGVGYFLTIK